MGIFSRFTKKIEKEKKRYLVAQTFYSRDGEIYNDSVELLLQTTNPDTFFSRYKLAEKCLSEIERKTRKTILKREYKEAKALQNELAIQKTVLTNAFIDRAIDAGKSKLLAENIWKYQSQMTEESIAYLAEQVGEIYMPQSNDKEGYIYCSVAFSEDGKTYYYFTDDESIQIGDRVIVQVGTDYKEATGTVVAVERFDKAEVPLPLEKIKRILRKV